MRLDTLIIRPIVQFLYCPLLLRPKVQLLNHRTKWTINPSWAMRPCGRKVYYPFKRLNISRIRCSCAAGGGFSIFLSENGLLYTCGDGRKGCLGHNSWNNVLRPTIIDYLITTCIVQVACGTSHVLALSSANKLYSWGSSSYGQLGLGHEKFCNLPTIVDLPKEVKPTNIFANYFSSAFLDSNKDLYVCGDNVFGKLGTQSDKVLHFKKNIIKEKVESVSIGQNHTMVITQNKKTIGMGKNTEGQLGLQNCKLTNTPRILQLHLNINMISCGETFTTAGTDNNAVYVWGTFSKEITSSKYLQKENEVKSHGTIISEVILQPKCILALYASKERLLAGHKIWLDNVLVIQNTTFIVVHTTAPPPLKKIRSGINNNNRSNIPDWMDTNVDFMQTTLPNTPQFT
ncbi:hypothetical protein FQR65_LT15074 [Abscondita terminalis]|nr:hypothetical protein FQR65_LT15074 [Abscondita terminalis]